MKWSRRVFTCLATLVLGIGLAGLVAPVGPAHAAGQPGTYYNGGIEYSTITNCPSIIFGSPYSEYGMGTYIGSWADPDDNLPQAGGVSYPVHIVLTAVGTACSAQHVWLGLDLPSGVTLDPTKAPECYYEGTRTTNSQECPTATQNGTYGAGTIGYTSGMSQYGNGWPVPVGKTWEFVFWVKANQPVNGAQVKGFVQIADGNSSPTLTPTTEMYAFGTGGGGGTGETPVIFHDQPSTYASPKYNLNGTVGDTKYGIISAGTLMTKGQYGTVYVERGLRPRLSLEINFTERASYAFNLDDPAFLFWTDWDEPAFSAILPDRTYVWRMGFQPTGSTTITWGETQSFRSLRQATCANRKVTVSLDLGQAPTNGDDVILGTAGADTITGGAGNDIICGGGGNDTITGGAGNDWMYGEAGNDVITGGEGHDELDGGEGNDILDGEDGNDFLLGAGGDDTLTGGLGKDNIRGGGGLNTASYHTAPSAVTVTLERQDDTETQETGGAGEDLLNAIQKLVGSDHNDTLTGSSGNDTIDGGAGNDTIDGRAGDDNLKGGAGVDRVSYASSLGFVRVSLALTGAQNTVGAGTDTLSGFENLDGGPAYDTLTGNSGNNVIRGLGAGDTLDGGLGNDTLDGGPGTDIVQFQAATSGVTVSLSKTGAQNTGGSGTVNLVGIEGLQGSPHADHLIGSTGNDTIDGGAGNDTLEGLVGNDTLRGGNGVDTLTYASASSGVTVSLALSSATGQNTGGAGTDHVSGFEVLQGSAHNDTLTGSDAADTIRGLAGNDTINGGGGNDTLDGGAGNDTIVGGTGTDLVTYASAPAAVRVSLTTTAAQNTGGGGTDTLSTIEGIEGSKYADKLTGDGGNNRLLGLGGNDRLVGGPGNDILNGGAGTDIVDYKSAPSGVTVSLAKTTAQNTRGAGTDTLSAIENIDGSKYADRLSGNAAANLIRGWGGNDQIKGGSGSDRLYGGRNNDVITGATGADKIYGEVGSDTLKGGVGNDQLYGATGNDKIYGNDGKDKLSGGGGKDKLYGGAGADNMGGGPARDLCDGGPARDRMAACEVQRNR